MEVWFVYVIRTCRGELYTGITTDVRRRIAMHRAGRGAKYLRGRAPLRVVYRRAVGDRRVALAVERRLKALTKTAKEALVARAPGRLRLLRMLELHPAMR